MRDCIREKMDLVRRFYPEERLKKSKQRWLDLWNGNLKGLDRYPFVYAPIFGKLDYYDVIDTAEDRLRNSLDEFIARGPLDDDFIPAFFPGCNTATIPNMFGAEAMRMTGDSTCKPVIFSENDIVNLPDARIGPVAQNWLDMQKYFLDETDGQIPVHVVDMQGPGDICGKLWNYGDLMVTMYTAPDLFHLLMDKVDAAFLKLWQAQQRLLGDAFQPTHLYGWNWMPYRDAGTLSFDSIVMISPEHFQEFYRPHLEKLATHFKDGIVIHSCGRLPQHADALAECHVIKGLNFGQMHLAGIVEAGFSNRHVFITYEKIDDLDANISLIKEHRLRVDMSLGGIWPNNEPETWTDDDLSTMLEKHEEVKGKMMRSVI